MRGCCLYRGGRGLCRSCSYAPAALIAFSLPALPPQNHYQGTNIFAVNHDAPFLERFRKVHVHWDKAECNPPDWKNRVMP